MNKQVVNGQQVEINPAIDGYVIRQKPSSNVEYFGLGPSGEIFVQFKSGKSYIYKDVQPEIWPDMTEAESIGKFISQRIVKDYKGLKHEERLVVPIVETQPAE